MSSFGYNGDISNSSSTGRSGSGPNESSFDGLSSGLHHFVHGMHSFNTANQLQLYLGRMAPGTRVNITHVAHAPSRGNNHAAINHHSSSPSPPMRSQSNSQGIALSLSPVFTPAPPAPPPSPAFPSYTGENRSARSQPANAIIPASLGPVVVGPAIVNFQTNPPPPGYERKHMMIVCHLHNRERTPEDIGEPRLVNPFGVGNAGSGPSSSHGNCSICRRVVRVDSQGRIFS